MYFILFAGLISTNLFRKICSSIHSFIYLFIRSFNHSFIYLFPENTIGHGRQRLSAVSTCQGLYCAEISTHNHVWYKDAKLNVQITTSWDSQNSHGPSASWVENVTGNKFKACVMQPGRASKTVGPVIQWFAYQGEVDEVLFFLQLT